MTGASMRTNSVRLSLCNNHANNYLHNRDHDPYAKSMPIMLYITEDTTRCNNHANKNLHN